MKSNADAKGAKLIDTTARLLLPVSMHGGGKRRRRLARPRQLASAQATPVVEQKSTRSEAKERLEEAQLGTARRKLTAGDGSAADGIDADLADMLSKALGVSGNQGLKDLVNCLILSECVYKVVDMGRRGATRVMERICSLFPPGVASIERVQWSQPSVHHRYLLAEDGHTVYAAFMGTKQRRDLVANAAVLQEPLWSASLAGDETSYGALPAAHRGFLSRANAIPIEALYAHACSQGKRLVLTGHSLGGAVAVLSLLRLMRQLPAGTEPGASALTFACPAIGNPELVQYAQERGWAGLFQNYLVPEDVVPRLLAGPRQSPEQVAAATIAALQPAGSAPPLSEASVEATLDLFDAVFEARLQGAELPTSAVARASRAATEGTRAAATAAAAELRQRAIVKERAAASEGVAAELRTLNDMANGGANGSEAPEREPGGAVLRSLDAEEGSWAWKDDAAATQSSSGLDEEDCSDFEQLQEPQGGIETAAAAGSARAGGQPRSRGRERLSSGQEVFFPWSARPLPVFAREMASAALRRAGSLGRLKGRRLPFLKDADAPLEEGIAELEAQVTSTSRSQRPVGLEMRVDMPGKSATRSESAALASAASARTSTGCDLPGDATFSPAEDLGAPEGGTSSRLARADGAGVEAAEGVEHEPSRRRWLANGQRIGKLGANVGRAATGAARNAAKLVASPIRAAQRRYAVLGGQAFLAAGAVLQVTAGEAEESFQKGLEGATAQSRASTLGTCLERASPSTIVSLQLPIAAARRRQPFLMHKMAFHRVRILSVLERALTERGLPMLRARLPTGMLSFDVAPPMQPTRAEAFLPYALPDRKDIEAMLEDIGSISDLPPMTALVKQAAGSSRFQWLLPWRWISGFGWGRTGRLGALEITAQIRGTGLENCTSAQVVEADSGLTFRTEIVSRPPQLSPYEAHGRLGLRRRRLRRQAARVAVWVRSIAREANALLDRTNAMGAADCLLVRVRLPLEAAARMEARLLQHAGDDSGLVLRLASDFRTAEVPLRVHGGGSWVVSDLRSSSRSLNDWFNQNITG